MSLAARGGLGGGVAVPVAAGRRMNVDVKARLPSIALTGFNLKLPVAPALYGRAVLTLNRYTPFSGRPDSLGAFPDI
jgi:hypothetical protein